MGAMEFYGTDLAAIHAAGFTATARAAAAVLLAALSGTGPDGPTHVVDLGCGSGALAAALTAVGCRVTAVDTAPAMLELARHAAPTAELHCASFYDFALPACNAVCLVGEGINYVAPDGRPAWSDLQALLERICGALRPGGLLLLDSAGPGRVPGGRLRSHELRADWAVLVEAVEDSAGLTVERAITSFFRTGAAFRRSDELHRLRLWPPDRLAALLETAGFSVVQRGVGYGGLGLPPGTTMFLARAAG
jgi:SAM-dependent methyltransferase